MKDKYKLNKEEKKLVYYVYFEVLDSMKKVVDTYCKEGNTKFIPRFLIDDMIDKTKGNIIKGLKGINES